MISPYLTKDLLMVNKLFSQCTVGCFIKNFFLIVRGRIAAIGFCGLEYTYLIFSDLKKNCRGREHQFYVKIKIFVVFDFLKA